MSEASVRAWLEAEAPDLRIIDHRPCLTVDDAAAAIGVAPAQIAKTLGVKVGARAVLIVTRGDGRLDNRSVKEALGHRPRLLPGPAVEALTGHAVGGVCPFGLPEAIPVYLDISLREFPTVFPAAGSPQVSIAIAPTRLGELVGATWAQLCSVPAAGGRISE